MSNRDALLAMPARQMPRPPGPKGVRFLALAPRLFADPLNTLSALSRRHGEVVCFRVGRAETYLANHPAIVEHVLRTNAKNYERSLILSELVPFIGNGLLTSKGTTWQAQRRRISPVFKPSVDVYGLGVLRDEAERWFGRFEGGTDIDAERTMKRLMLRVMVRTMFSPDVRLDDEHLIDHLETLLGAASFKSHALRRMRYLQVWKPTQARTDWMPASYWRALEAVDRFVLDIIAQCRAGTMQPGLLLERFLDDDADSDLLRDEMNTFLFAGFDTTAVVITWALYELARHPEAAQQLRADIQAAGIPTTVEEMEALPYLQAVVLEALRMYPPAWAFHRVAKEVDMLGDHPVYARAHIMICPYTLQRHPDFWDDPDAFRPERFEGQRALAPKVGFEFVPFGHGPRTCIGKRLGVVQAMALVAWLVAKFDIERVGPRTPRITPGIIIKAKTPVRLRVTRRPS